ncbi:MULTISPECIES: iron-containing alcohol dehydrogenase [unclassified Shinella]|uniref:iron-containing alcohol dehydrogenase n=1 Tax=unclassified Shinella TaxID=2643062 RepID=UPI00225CF5D3|nr:iron-containing alcohol dehydrogenase [Shinella sp. YE25]MDC7258737.1 iron-containing alcohol dehydrogenase [Shinella sp. YE25]CAI0334498.1 sn-glycerol-1-phosphate dehydrogenase [Rhizobiaceae bacterium]CAK7260674.1 glycerol-1-phosphate dehydrogenase [NAD(P)+] [Shinella sp. WSC3-e]
MSLDLRLSDLSRLDTIRAALSQNDPRGQFEPLGLKEVAISGDVLDGLTGTIDRHLSAAGLASGPAIRVHLMVDPVVIRRNGGDLKGEVFRKLSERYAVTRVTLDDGHAVLHADDPILDEAARRAVGADCIVSVGSGTITDIAKVAAMRSNVPVHIVIQTAASVDGYTDNFSVVLQNGVKRTLLTRWPEAVLTDTRTVCEAPHVLNASGFGELMSMYSAPGDWFLACRLGLDSTFAPILLDLLALCGEGVGDWSEGVGKGDHDACARLASALAMRGIVTGVGGTTAALSGMEHLFSHMLDMVAGERGAPMGLHGAQVGVGSVIRAAAWEVFSERWSEARPDPASLFPDIGTWESRVGEVFAMLDPSGRIGAECWSRYGRKLADWHGARGSVEAFFADWAENRARHDALVLGSHEIARYLHRANAPMRHDQLDPMPSADLARWVVANCQFMRERFTVADLLTLAGWWDEAGVQRVLDRVDEACNAARGAGR